MALLKLVYEIAVAAVVTALAGSASVAAGEEEKTLPECAIYLSEFGRKEEIRLGHGFHIACVNAWRLCAHSSCPSCNRIVVVVDMTPHEMTPECKRRRKCEAMEEASSSSSSA